MGKGTEYSGFPEGFESGAMFFSRIMQFGADLLWGSMSRERPIFPTEEFIQRVAEGRIANNPEQSALCLGGVSCSNGM